MDEEDKGTLKMINEKLEDLRVTLKRIEDRQIAVREEIKEAAPPVVGSFASTDK
jgi:hypothetical protein